MVMFFQSYKLKYYLSSPLPVFGNMLKKKKKSIDYISVGLFMNSVLSH